MPGGDLVSQPSAGTGQKTYSPEFVEGWDNLYNKHGQVVFLQGCANYCEPDKNGFVNHPVNRIISNVLLKNIYTLNTKSDSEMKELVALWSLEYDKEGPNKFFLRWKDFVANPENEADESLVNEIIIGVLKLNLSSDVQDLSQNKSLGDVVTSAVWSSWGGPSLPSLPSLKDVEQWLPGPF